MTHEGLGYLSEQLKSKRLHDIVRLKNEALFSLGFYAWLRINEVIFNLLDLRFKNGRYNFGRYCKPVRSIKIFHPFKMKKRTDWEEIVKNDINIIAASDGSTIQCTICDSVTITNGVNRSFNTSIYTAHLSTKQHQNRLVNPKTKKRPYD
jgi:hypothetical protein